MIHQIIRLNVTVQWNIEANEVEVDDKLIQKDHHVPSQGNIHSTDTSSKLKGQNPVLVYEETNNIIHREEVSDTKATEMRINNENFLSL